MVRRTCFSALLGARWKKTPMERGQRWRGRTLPGAGRSSLFGWFSSPRLDTLPLRPEFCCDGSRPRGAIRGPTPFPAPCAAGNDFAGLLHHLPLEGRIHDFLRRLPSRPRTQFGHLAETTSWCDGGSRILKPIRVTTDLPEAASRFPGKPQITRRSPARSGACLWSD